MSPEVMDSITNSKSDQKRAVVKRCGSVVSWDAERILRAVALAFHEVRNGTAENPYRNAPDNLYGVNPDDWNKVIAIAERVEKLVEFDYAKKKRLKIEDIQDLVERAIWESSEMEVAKSYILYRARKQDKRLNRYQENGIQDYLAVAKYSRYIDRLKRRETFEETVNRSRDMHLERFLQSPYPIAENHRQPLEDKIRTAFEAIQEKRFLPSMRGMQFGGPSVLRNHARLYNCSYTAIDRVHVFQEIMFLLLSGCGVGFSVQKQHIAKLPPLVSRPDESVLPVVHFQVPDHIEGWADAVGMLVRSYTENYYVEFDYSLIRKKGARLHLSGGKAPGHLPLKASLEDIRQLLTSAAGRHLKPIEAYDLCMFMARAVLSGGIRRSATICLFSEDDLEMATAKTGDWNVKARYRGYSNNSAVLERANASREAFSRLFHSVKEFGEPGFFFAESKEYGTNPCCEISMNPSLHVDNPELLARLEAAGLPVHLGDRLSGVQFCNLCTINVGKVKTKKQFYEVCDLAAFVGTLQATYTTFPYLGIVSEEIARREALLGVSICGFMDNPDLMFNKEVLKKGAAIVKQTNSEWSKVLSISAAARTTCVKPEGTASLILGTASGIGTHHDRRYFRRVQANRIEAPYMAFKKANPHLCEPSAWSATDDVITFCIEAPENAITRGDLTAIEFLERVHLVQKYWVEEGTQNMTYSPGLHNNVSNTVNVKEDEWKAVEDYIWENRHHFTGIALLAWTGDKEYMQAPREAVADEADVQKWNRLRYNPVDYTTVIEEEDNTTLQDTAACAGGKCEISISL